MPEPYSTVMREMAENDRPRERLVALGARALSSSELIAIILSTGSKEYSVLSFADYIIREMGGLRAIGSASPNELMDRIKGLGPAKASQILAAIELGKRLGTVDAENRPTVTQPGDVANLLMPEMRDLLQEQLRVLLLDTKNKVLRNVLVTQGLLDSSLAHARECFREAIIASARSVIIVHNHPSGDPSPSQADISITRRLVEAGKVVDIDVIDHVIIGHNTWVSLKSKGLMD